MAKNRFDLVCDSNLEWLMQSKLLLPIRDKYTHKKISLKQCLDLLNSLAQEEHLKSPERITYLEAKIRLLEAENKTLQSQISWDNIKCSTLHILYDWNKKVEGENEELKQEIESLKMEIAELKESERDNYNITDGLW